MIVRTVGRNWRVGRFLIHSCLPWPDCWRERRRGFGFWLFAVRTDCRDVRLGRRHGRWVATRR